VVRKDKDSDQKNRKPSGRADSEIAGRRAINAFSQLTANCRQPGTRVDCHAMC
jgi:hypothetical protein